MQHTFCVEFYLKPFCFLPPPSLPFLLFLPNPSSFLPLPSPSLSSLPFPSSIPLYSSSLLSSPSLLSFLPPSIPLSLSPPLPPPQIARQILEAHASMLTLSMHDAKLQYIRNWQALQDFGITYFLVKVGRSRKEVS